MARVQRLTFADRSHTYTVVDEDNLPVSQAREYLRFLGDQGASPNTVRAYAYGLAAWWTLLDHTGASWDDFPTSLFGQFLAYLRTGDLPGPARIGKPEQAMAESSLQPRGAAVLSMYRYFAQAHDLDRPYRRLFPPMPAPPAGRYVSFLTGTGQSRPRCADLPAPRTQPHRNTGTAAGPGQRDLDACRIRNLFRGAVLWRGGLAGPAVLRGPGRGRPLLQGSVPVRQRGSLSLCSSEADSGDAIGCNRCGASGLAMLHRRRAGVLSRAMSSRLAARAAARSSSRSSSCCRRSRLCCSSWLIRWWSASMSVGAPSPDSRQVCSPSAWESRCSSWPMRASRRAARSWAASRSACSEARVTPGPVCSSGTGSACSAWIFSSRSGCR